MINRRILVLGSGGFIGNAYAEAMATAGHEVLGLRRGPDAVTDRFHRAASFDSASLLKIVSEFRPDLCLNAAGSSRPAASFDGPETDFAANTTLVLSILEALRQGAPACRYIGLSSAAVYGSNPDLPWKEGARGYPSSPYGYHKLAAELLGEEYARLFGLKVLTLRAFSVYGPGLRRQLFWDIFCRSRTASELKLFGTGKETRDFIYIDDVVSALEWFADHAAFEGEIFNLASGHPTRIADACEGLLRNLGWSGRPSFTGEQIPGAPARMEADMTRTFELGFRCRVDLPEGLRRTAAWLLTTTPHGQA